MICINEQNRLYKQHSRPANGLNKNMHQMYSSDENLRVVIAFHNCILRQIKRFSFLL